MSNDPVNFIDPRGLTERRPGPIGTGDSNDTVPDGYIDLNVSVNIFPNVIVTGGVQIYGNQNYFYIGGGYGTSGMSFTLAPGQSPTPGLNAGVQLIGSDMVGVQVGASKEGPFGEIGFGIPGYSATAIYVCE